MRWLILTILLSGCAARRPVPPLPPPVPRKMATQSEFLIGPPRGWLLSWNWAGTNGQFNVYAARALQAKWALITNVNDTSCLITSGKNLTNRFFRVAAVIDGVESKP